MAVFNDSVLAHAEALVDLRMSDAEYDFISRKVYTEWYPASSLTRWKLAKRPRGDDRAEGEFLLRGDAAHEADRQAALAAVGTANADLFARHQDALDRYNGHGFEDVIAFGAVR